MDSDPVVLQTLSGTAVARNSGVDMNANDQIAGNYRAAGGVTRHFYRNPTATGTAGVNSSKM